MRLCFIADYGSPTAVNWIDHFARLGHDVHVISTGACKQHAAPVRLHTLGPASAPRGGAKYRLPDPASYAGRIAQALWRSVVLPRRVWRYSKLVRSLVAEIRPDILHCLRIPIEGELGLFTGFRPFVVSIWGNDLTLYAGKSLPHRILTRRVLAAAAAILADCQADLDRSARFAKLHGVEMLVTPGGGGVRAELFAPGEVGAGERERLGIPAVHRVVLNPRGVRGYVRHDTVFAAMAQVKRQLPDVSLVCVGLKGWPAAEAWVKRYDLGGHVVLTDVLSQRQLAQLFRLAEVSVSISEHDGTPNSLLEAMASGSIPICGDLASTREWIQSGVNGWLVPADGAGALAAAILGCFRDETFRRNAAAFNQNLIRERATYPTCMVAVEELYRRVAGRSSTQTTPRRPVAERGRSEAPGRKVHGRKASAASLVHQEVPAKS